MRNIFFAACMLIFWSASGQTTKRALPDLESLYLLTKVQDEIDSLSSILKNFSRDSFTSDSNWIQNVVINDQVLSYTSCVLSPRGSSESTKTFVFNKSKELYSLYVMVDKLYGGKSERSQQSYIFYSDDFNAKFSKSVNFAYSMSKLDQGEWDVLDPIVFKKFDYYHYTNRYRRLPVFISDIDRQMIHKELDDVDLKYNR